MKKLLFSIAFVLLLCMSSSAAGKAGREYVIGFYNVENLFDTVDNPHANDEEFLPEGKNEWTEDRYRIKLHNIATVIKAMADANGKFHSVLGLAEVENSTVLKDLVAQPELKKAGFRYVHKDCPDPRGIDVALLYNPKEFKYIDSESIPFSFDRDANIKIDISEADRRSFRTRDILMVHGKIAGEEFAFYVTHLPSRIGGKGTDTRCIGADIIYRHSQKMQKKYPGIKIVVMGDMNDDPIDESQTRWLHAKATIEETGANDFFCPFTRLLKEGNGSLEYKGKWNIFDIIEVNRNLASPDAKGLRIKPVDAKGHYGKVFKPAFLTQQSGRYKGTPFRTFSNGQFIKGYSDHYPTYIIIGK